MSERLRRFIHEIHRRSLWQVLGIYVVASWAVLQVVDTLGGVLNLPEGFDSVAFALLILGLPIVLATAFLAGGVPRGAGTGDTNPHSGPQSGSRATRNLSALWRPIAVTFASLFLVSAGVVGWSLRRPEVPVGVGRYASPFGSGQVATYGQRGSYALSPDGSFLAYRVGGGVLMIRRWSELEPLAVAGVEAMVQPTVSPDGRHVAFAQAEQIRVAPISGGPMRTLATGGWPYWGRDGYIYMSEVPGPGSTGPIVRVPEAGGPHERVSQLVGEDFGHQLVHILPDGRRALMVARVEGGDREIRVLQLDTGEMRILTGGRNARYSETGHMVYLTPDGTLMADVLDTDAVELAGRPIIIADGVEAFSMSENGTLFYSLFSGARTEFVWVTRTGVATPDHPGWTFNAGGGNPAWSLSPDGTRVAMRAITDENEDIWIKELGGGPNSRLTFDESQDWSPHWTPDGETVTFVSIRAGDRDVWTKRADGTGVAELLYDHEKRIVEALWSRDGKWLVLRGGALGAAAGTRDILAMRWGVDAKARPLIAEPYDEREPALSPDSRWISYVSNETGSNEVFLRPFPDVNAGRWQVSNSGGSMPVWANSGRELFFVDSDRLLVAVEIAPESDSSPVRDRQPLFTLPPEFRVSQNNTLYGVAPDDDRFLWARTNEEGDAGSRFILVQNFDEELKRLVPN